jgi:hypothetical protein
MIEQIKLELISQGYSLPKELSVSDKLISFDAFINASLPNNSTEEIAKALGVSYSALNAQLSRHYRKVFSDKPTGTLSWARYLVSKLQLLICTNCYEYKELEMFSNCIGKYLNKGTLCKTCARSYNKNYYRNNKQASNIKSAIHYINNKSDYVEKSARRRAAKILATPIWADMSKIKEIYLLCPEGMHVDHMIPLNNPLVCGLHVHNNLQYLTAQENLQKSNSFNPF